MLSLILRRICFWFWAKIFFLWSFSDHFCQKRFFKILAVSGTLKIITNFDFLMRMLRPLCAHWAYESGTDAWTEHTGQERMLTVSIQVRNWCVRWAYGSGTEECAEHTSQELIRALSAHMKFEKIPSKHSEHTRQELMRTLSIRVRNWCVRWAYA